MQVSNHIIRNNRIPTQLIPGFVPESIIRFLLSSKSYKLHLTLMQDKVFIVAPVIYIPPYFGTAVLPCNVIKMILGQPYNSTRIIQLPGKGLYKQSVFTNKYVMFHIGRLSDGIFKV